MNLDLVKHAKNYIEKMANGINPLTGEKVSDNDLINNVRIVRCLFYVNDVLERLLDNGGVTKNNRVKKAAFYLDKDVLNKYDYSEGDLPISKIVKKINNLKINENITNLKITSVCNWLVNIGLLKEIDDNGKKTKRPTETGLNLGMYVKHKSGSYGAYDIVMYTKNMQEFIINNFDSLLEFINK